MLCLPRASRVLAFAVALAALPSLAFHDDGGSSGARCDGCLVATAVVAAAFDVAFLAVGIPTLVTGGHFSPFWSVVEGLWGLGHVIVGGILTPVGALSLGFGHQEGGALLGSGILILLVGAWLVTHAIICIKRYFSRDRHPRQAAVERLVPLVGASVDARGGGGVSLAWRF